MRQAIKRFYTTPHYDYFVTTYGDIYRYNKVAKSLRQMACSMADGKYRLVVLEHGKKTWYVHRLVYEMFVGPIPEGYVVDHIDNTHDNNRLDNLQLLTNKQNVQKYYNEVYWQDKFDEMCDDALDLEFDFGGFYIGPDDV